jgi:ribonucleoside-diphosphate reductase alpha chain
VIREGKKSKEKVEVYSASNCSPTAPGERQGDALRDKADAKLPDYFVAADDITPKEHVDIQAASQKWVDSSISKTANVPTDYAYEDFKDIYRYAYERA